VSARVRFLCVDDSKETRNLFALMLGDAPAFDGVGSLSGVADLEWTIAESRPDVVILDRWIPGSEPLSAMRPKAGWRRV
jgi:hypothetical protein